MSAETPRDEFKYWAFICYSHTDEKWANWLHKSLETYSIPKHLVGTRTREGIVPRRIFPVFRDRDELPGSAKLGDEIEAALRKSRYLIVICSPRAVTSKWVDQEIRIFKSLGREERVLCLVVEGEPHATTRPGVTEPECLPESVRYWVDANRNITQIPTEPIAADIRKGKDGKKNAVLKLLAGILGVDYDALKQRDEERRQRQQHIMLASAVSLLIIFSLLVAQFYAERLKALESARLAEEQKELAEKARAEAIQQEKKAQEAREAAEKARQEAQENAINAKKAAVEAEMQAAKAQEALQLREQAIAQEQRARAEAEAARRIAEENERRMKGILAISDFTTASRLVEEGNEPKALAYLSRALRYDPENAAVVSRIISLLSQKTWALPVMDALKHNDVVRSVLFSPDGNYLVSISGNTAHVWDRKTAKPVYAPLEHGQKINSVELSADGSLLVTASNDGTAQVWELKTGTKVGAPLSHGDWVLHASFSPDRKLVATAGQDKTARIWEVSNGNLLHTLRHSGPVRMAQFTPNGLSVVTIASNTAQRWEVSSGEAIGLAMQHDGGVYTMTISENGRWIATGAGDRTARVWNAITGEQAGPPLQHDNWVVSLQFSPDEWQLLTASSDRKVRLWNIPAGTLEFPPMRHNHEVVSARFSPNARWIVTASLDGNGRIWSAATGEQVVEALNHSLSLQDARFSPDGKYVATASADRTVKLWEITSGKPAVEPMRHEQQVNSACFSPDGKLLATVSNDRSARIWDVISSKPVTEPLRHNGAVISIAFSPDGAYLATGSEDGTAQLWNTRTGKPVFSEPLAHNSWVNSVSFSPNGQWLVTASEDRRVRVWDVATGNLVYQPLRHDGIVKSATFSPDGRWIVTASHDKNVRVWNALTREAVSPSMEHTGEVRAAVLSPDSKWLLTGSEDKTARLWDPATGKMLLDPLHHDSAVNIVDFTPADVWAERKWILTVADSVARIWDATTGKAITEPLKHDGPIRTAQFGPQGNLLVTASGNKVQIWETSSGRLVTEPLIHEKEVRSVAFSPDGNFVVTTSADQAARIWLATLRGKAPAWFSELADAVGGYKLGNHGAAEVFSDSWNDFMAIRAALEKLPDDDVFAIWTRWFLADRTTRTISAFSSTRLDDYVHRRIAHGDRVSVNEALDFQPNNSIALMQLAKLSNTPEQADFYSRLAVQYQPENSEILWNRAQILQNLNRPAQALAVMERAIALDPRNVRSFGPNGNEFSSADPAKTGASGWLPLGWRDFSETKMIYSRIFDVPHPGLTALRISKESAGHGELRGPRVICKRNAKFVIEGWVRSPTSTDLSVGLQQFIEPYEKYKEQVIRTTTQWKPFKIHFTPTRDIAAELRLLQISTGIVEVADVKIVEE